ncbi:MAG TPA: permease-like cell division protein FtsX [Acidimicrobiales bacterium]|nr:permease-like cell division protein FtsX [Acidimicrobiales bacterium]
MPVSINYVARETATNLKRNVGMTVAAILTVAVSLSLVGSALLMRQGVNKANLQWRGGIELSIFMRSDAPQGQIDAIERELRASPEVKRYLFVDKKAALAEYKELYQDNDELQDILTEEDMPTSFRVVPAKAELAESIGRRFKTRAGVEQVAFAAEQVDALLKTTRQRQAAYFGVAIVLLFGAVLLIFNAIQLAVLNRRREIEVMKLVGATNWFIRLPFMLEGLLQGLAGGLVAALLVYVFRGPIFEVVSDPTITQSLRKIQATASEARNTGLVLMLTGAGVGALSSALAVRRHLRV